MVGDEPRKTRSGSLRRGPRDASLDSGLPVIHGRDDVEYINASDEHSVIEDKRVLANHFALANS